MLPCELLPAHTFALLARELARLARPDESSTLVKNCFKHATYVRPIALIAEVGLCNTQHSDVQKRGEINRLTNTTDKETKIASVTLSKS